MPAGNKINVFVEDQFEGVHDWDGHTFKFVLTNTAPVATNSVLADLTQIANGNGYTTGGTATTITTSRSGGTFKAVGTDVVFTATGAVGPFRYAALYNDTPTSPADPLVAWWDYGSSISMVNGDTFTIDIDATNGILQVT